MGGIEGADDVTFFSRSGNLTSPSITPMFWSGDQNTNLDGCDGVLSAVIGMMSAGFSGWTIMHADVGAFLESSVAPRSKYADPLSGSFSPLSSNAPISPWH